MIKKLVLFLFSIFINSSLIQASWSEKISNIGLEIGKKIMQYPVTSIAVGTIVANVLPFYYRRKAVQLNKETAEVLQTKAETTQALNERQKRLGEISKRQKYYLDKFESIRDTAGIATVLGALPAAMMAYAMSGKDDETKMKRVAGVFALTLSLSIITGGRPF